MNKHTDISRTQLQERYILYGIIVIICLAPLPFGSARSEPFAIIAILIGALSIYWGNFATKTPVFVRISLAHVKWPAIMIAIVLLWGVIQIIPFGDSDISSPFWLSAKQLLPNGNIKSSISINRYESWSGIVRILSYTIFFWLVLQVARSSNNVYKMLVALQYSGVGYAIYGILIQATGAKKILWYNKVAYTDSLTSTFVNRNNYATYAGVVLIISIAMLLKKLFENAENIKKHKFVRTLTERLFTTSVYSLVIVILIASSLILSASRAGISASLLGVTVFILFCIFTKRNKKYVKFLSTIYLLIFILVGLVFNAGGDLAAHRYGRVVYDAESRIGIYKTTINAIEDFPLKGTGLGTFNDISKVYRDKTIPKWHTTQVTYAHNTYLELMLELGIPIAICFMLVLAWVIMRCAYGAIYRKQNTTIPAIATSVAILVCSHALFDFSAQIPAIALIFVVLLAAGLAQSWSKRVILSDVAQHTQIYHKISTNVSVALGGILILAGIYQLSSSLFITNSNHYKDVAIEKIALAKAEGIFTKTGKELLISAEHSLYEAIATVPTDSYAWTYLAYSKFLTSEDRNEVTKLFIASISNGFYDPSLVLFRLRFIPILWSSASDDEKTMFSNQVKLAWENDPKKTVEMMSSSLSRELLVQTLHTTPDSSKDLEKFYKLEQKK